MKNGKYFTEIENFHITTNKVLKTAGNNIDNKLSFDDNVRWGQLAAFNIECDSS